MINEGEPTGMEPTESKRTGESEIKANVEFWKGTKWELSEEEVRKAIEEIPEVEGYDWYIVMPKGIKLSKIFQMMGEHYPNQTDLNLGKVKIPESQSETYAIAAKFQQEPDEDSLGDNAKSAFDWEKTNYQFMNPAVWSVAEMRWNQENGSHLEEKNYVIFPHSKYSEDLATGTTDVPCGHFRMTENKKVDLSHTPNWRTNKFSGVRRVITKDSKVSE